jgi:hypothetical protein
MSTPTELELAALIIVLGAAALTSLARALYKRTRRRSTSGKTH